MGVKLWYESRSMWTWLGFAFLLVVLPMFGVDATPEMVKGYEEHILIVAGVILRWITGEPVTWKQAGLNGLGFVHFWASYCGT